jgi:Tol biopolymer transport system component
MGAAVTARFLVSVVLSSVWLPIAAAPQIPSKAATRFLTTDAAVNDYGPCFSPDGLSVLFSRRVDGSTTSQLFTVPSSGGQATNLVKSGIAVSATRPNWSPRNNLIAFTGISPDDKYTIWLVNADGTAPRKLDVAGVSDRVYYPSWYPDGSHLAVLDGGERVIKKVNREALTAVTLTDPRAVFTGMPSVSPDGKWIAFAGQKNVGQRYDQTKNSIWLLTEDRRVRLLEPSQAQGRTPSWSPDGEWLAFESNRGSADPSLYAAFIIARDGTGLRQITSYDLNANHPVWSPDGRRLAFSARHTKGSNRTGIAIVDLPSSRDARRLIH